MINLETNGLQVPSEPPPWPGRQAVCKNDDPSADTYPIEKCAKHRYLTKTTVPSFYLLGHWQYEYPN